MTVLVIAGIIVAFCILIWIAFATNDYCFDKYRYEPFGIGNTLLMVLVWILAIVSFFSIPESGSLFELVEQLKKIEFADNYLDSISAIYIGAGIMLVFLIRTTMKTSFPIALLALFIQLLASIFILLVVFLLIKKD